MLVECIIGDRDGLICLIKTPTEETHTGFFYNNNYDISCTCFRLLRVGLPYQTNVTTIVLNSSQNDCVIRMFKTSQAMHLSVRLLRSPVGPRLLEYILFIILYQMFV